MLATLTYTGPTVYVHLLDAQQGKNDLIMLAWRDEGGAETEMPSFAAKGTVDQVFGVLKERLRA